MTRTGYSKDQQHQVKQLIFECSLAKMSSFQTQQVLKEKLDVSLTISWINRIKAEFKEDARREYYHLLTDNFAYKYLTMEVMQQLHEIIKQQWDIANNNKGKNDFLALKALSEVKESVLRTAEFYKYLPEIENNLFSLRRNHKDLNESSYTHIFEVKSIIKNGRIESKYQDINSPTFDLDKEPTLSEKEKKQIRDGILMVAGRADNGELYLDCTHESNVPGCEYCKEYCWTAAADNNNRNHNDETLPF